MKLVTAAHLVAGASIGDTIEVRVRGYRQTTSAVVAHVGRGSCDLAILLLCNCSCKKERGSCQCGSGSCAVVNSWLLSSKYLKPEVSFDTASTSR